jgi:hypothetical protein
VRQRQRQRDRETEREGGERQRETEGWKEKGERQREVEGHAVTEVKREKETISVTLIRLLNHSTRANHFPSLPSLMTSLTR